MTYRADSDFPIPYGAVYNTRKLPEKIDEYILNYGRKNKFGKDTKNKNIAWFVSNCQSKSLREDYVKNLQKYIPVDIYGQCGKLKCHRDENIKCWDKVEDEYKFYLSFENSICRDYVTEKFFDAMNRTVIPIVLGGGDYESFSPRHSYIDAFHEYKNPRDLAKYLEFLTDNPDKYAEYFWWKDHYSIHTKSATERSQTMCQLCQKLHQDNTNKVIDDLEDWWINKSKCRSVHIRQQY